MVQAQIQTNGNLIAGDHYRWCAEYSAPEVTNPPYIILSDIFTVGDNPSAIINVEIPDVHGDSPELPLARAVMRVARLGHGSVQSDDLIVSPIFSVPPFVAFVGITYTPTGANLDDYFAWRRINPNDTLDAIIQIKKDVFDAAKSVEENIQFNVNLFVEYDYSLPKFLFYLGGPVKPKTIIIEFADNKLGLNYNLEAFPKTVPISGTAYAHHPVSYTDDITIGHKKIPITKTAPRTAQYSIARNAHEHTTFPSDLHYYLLQLISSGINNLPVPQKIIITEYITSGPDVARPYFKKVGELRPPIITRVINGDDALCTFIDNAVDAVMQDGKTYYIGIADSTVAQLSGPILYDTTQTAGHGGIEMGTYRDQDNDFITFRLHRDYHNLDADANTRAIIEHIKSGSGILPEGTVIDILNKPDADGNATHFETLILQSAAVFNEYNPTTEYYGVSLELGLGHRADFQDKVLGFRIPVNFNTDYDYQCRAVLSVPLDNQELSPTIISLFSYAIPPDDRVLLEQILDTVQANNVIVSNNKTSIVGLTEDIDEMRRNIADSEYDSYTGATVTHHIPIHDHVSGDRISFENVSIIKSIFGKFGSPVPTPITLTIQKLDGNNLVGEVLHTQTFESPLGSLGEEVSVKLDKLVELEAGDYAFGYVSGEVAAYFGTASQDAKNPGNTKLRWYAGDAAVSEENGTYTTVKITYNEKLGLGEILKPINDITDFADEKLTYTEISESHRRVKLHKDGKVIATWDETKLDNVWTRSSVMRS